MNKKIKVFVISDHPFSPSGVGTQTRYMIEGLLKTGNYSFVCFGGAIKHRDYNPQKTEEWGDDFLIYPIDGYGTQDSVRSIIRTEKPDLLWFMTDPRFYGWLWEIEDEIRSLVPMVYYHVWDNYPYPVYNQVWYNSCDHIACISKLTHDIVKTVSPDVDSSYLPHAVDPVHFNPLGEEKIKELRQTMEIPEDKFVVFWNNRNAKRKQPGTLIHIFNQFLEKVGKDKAMLIMHTDPKDQNGPDLVANINHLGLTNGEVKFSTQKVEFADLAAIYNVADVTINIADAEGFGLATLESLSCGTPIIVNMTGGLQEQITDGTDFFGIPLLPSSKSIIGSQGVPYIYEDRIDKDQFLSALSKIYNISNTERRKMGLLGRKHVEKNYSFDNFNKTWVNFIDSIIDENGSWETRKNYNGIRFLEVA